MPTFGEGFAPNTEGNTSSFKTVNREYYKYLKNYYQPKERSGFQNEVGRYNLKYKFKDKEPMVPDMNIPASTPARIPMIQEHHKSL